MAIKSHNKDNPSVDDVWNEWPKDMNGIMHLLLGYIPSKWDKKSGAKLGIGSRIEKQWFEFAQFVDYNNIQLKENTFTITGNHGTIFAFDANMGIFLCGSPQTPQLSIWMLSGPLERVLGIEVIPDNHNSEHGSINRNMETAINGLEEELGFGDFPSHVKGLELKQFESPS